jgi:hypothetical protein
LHDDYEATVGRFREGHPQLAARVGKALFERYACPVWSWTRNVECEWRAWDESGSP